MSVNGAAVDGALELHDVVGVVRRRARAHLDRAARRARPRPAPRARSPAGRSSSSGPRSSACGARCRARPRGTARASRARCRTRRGRPGTARCRPCRRPSSRPPPTLARNVTSENESRPRSAPTSSRSRPVAGTSSATDGRAAAARDALHRPVDDRRQRPDRDVQLPVAAGPQPAGAVAVDLLPLALAHVGRDRRRRGRLGVVERDDVLAPARAVDARERVDAGAVRRRPGAAARRRAASGGGG